jgi:hypothetical protein
MPPPNKEGAFCCTTFVVRLCFFGGVLFRKSLAINDLRGPRRRNPLVFNALRNNFFLNLFKFSLDSPPLLCHNYSMTVKNTKSDLAQKLEEVTETLNRVCSVIRASNIDRGNALDPKGLIDMTKEEYAAHLQKLQDISDEHDKRQAAKKGYNTMTSEQIDEMIADLETAQLCNGLAGLGGQD